MVFEEVLGSRSIPGLCWWLLPYPGKISMSLDQGSVCGAWEKSGSRDVSVVEEAWLVYYMELEVKGDNVQALTYSFPILEPVCYSMSGSNCCFLKVKVKVKVKSLSHV